MIDKKRLQKNQLERKRKIKKRKRNNRIKLVSLFLVLSISVTSWYFAKFSNKNANADSAKLLTDKYDKKNIEKKSKEEAKDKFYDVVISYKKVVEDTQLLESLELDSHKLLNIKKNEYIKYLGEEKGWSKVQHKGYSGYVRSSKLRDTAENQLKIVNGILVVSKDNYIPKDFETRFSVETESAMMVMIEAIRRDGLNIDIANKYIDSSFEKGEKNYPDIEYNELRTGEAVEFKSASGGDLDNTDEKKWLEKNAHKYGFVLRYPKNKEKITGFKHSNSIYRYVGTEYSIKMYEKNMTIEEYFNLKRSN